MNQYKITVKITGHTIVEDPKRPASYMNSGLYDIDVPGYLYADVDVFAHDEEEARSLAESSEDYTIDEFADIESVRVVACSLDRDDRDEEELGIGEIDYGEIDWREPMDRDAELEFLADMAREERWIN